ncbi:MAG: ankyrin repeat domain-containing protein [Alphaproteobacteria bacterium]|nr:ankyrin repeat domain-containing protein [Alphaproteobacteria bacterium]
MEEQTQYNSEATKRLLAAKTAGEVKKALRDGANPNAMDEEGNTALMHLWHNPIAVQLLISAGTALDIRNADGMTALMLACQGGEAESAKLLIEAGADMNVRDNEFGMTALMLACTELPSFAYTEKVIRGQSECVKLLLNAGADPTIKDNKGKMAVDYAKDWSKHLIEKEMKNQGFFSRQKNTQLRGRSGNSRQ